MMNPAGDQNAKARTQDFLTFASAAAEGISYTDAKGMLPNVSSNQAETRKSLFEELGLLFVPYRSDTILVTPLGNQLAEILTEQDLNALTPAVLQEASALLIWAQCRSQINRPQSRGAPRLQEDEWRECDVRPYAAAWLATNHLQQKLYMHEFMGSLRKVQLASELDAAISVIQNAREAGNVLADESTWTGRGPEMNYDIYWRSHMSVAMDWLPDKQMLQAKKGVWGLVEAALKFQSGCGGNMLDAVRAASWSDAEDYFMNVAGAACPPFLASGEPRIRTFGEQNLADLRDYSLLNQPHTLRVVGGPELCNLPIKMPCYHPDFPARLLRIDGKRSLSNGRVEVELGKGRPVVDLDLLEKALEG